MDAGTIGTLLFAGVVVALVVVLVAMARSNRVRSEARTRQGWLGSQPWWVRIAGLLVLLGGAFIVIQR